MVAFDAFSSLESWKLLIHLFVNPRPERIHDLRNAGSAAVRWVLHRPKDGGRMRWKNGFAQMIWVCFWQSLWFLSDGPDRPTKSPWLRFSMVLMECRWSRTRVPQPSKEVASSSWLNFETCPIHGQAVYTYFIMFHNVSWKKTLCTMKDSATWEKSEFLGQLSQNWWWFSL